MSSPEPVKLVYAGGVRVPVSKVEALRRLSGVQPGLAAKLAAIVSGCPHRLKPIEIQMLQEGGFMKGPKVDAEIAAIVRCIITDHAVATTYDWDKLTNLSPAN